jgi:hypothetical protein
MELTGKKLRWHRTNPTGVGWAKWFYEAEVGEGWTYTLFPKRNGYEVELSGPQGQIERVGWRYYKNEAQRTAALHYGTTGGRI